MFEVAFTLSTKRTKEAGNIPDPIRVCFLMLIPVKVLVIYLLNNLTIINILNIMLAIAIFAITSAGEITILSRS
jgi:hypothetical protein